MKNNGCDKITNNKTLNWSSVSNLNFDEFMTSVSLAVNYWTNFTKSGRAIIARIKSSKTNPIKISLFDLAGHIDDPGLFKALSDVGIEDFNLVLENCIGIKGQLWSVEDNLLKEYQ